MKSKIIWFTESSGAGKTTLSKILSIWLAKLNFKVQNIDRDSFRKKIIIINFQKETLLKTIFP